MSATAVTSKPKLEDQLRQRIKEIERSIERLQAERQLVEQRLKTAQAQRTPKPAAKKPTPLVHCPKCGRDRDFLTDNGGYLGHVLEDPTDVEELEAGKPLFCPACGEVFLYTPKGGKGR